MKDTEKKKEQNRNNCRHQNEQKDINSSNVNQNQAKLTHVFSTLVQRKPKKVNRQ